VFAEPLTSNGKNTHKLLGAIYDLFWHSRVGRFGGNTQAHRQRGFLKYCGVNTTVATDQTAFVRADMTRRGSECGPTHVKAQTISPRLPRWKDKELTLGPSQLYLRG
jgi:hypothetical protein